MDQKYCLMLYNCVDAEGNILLDKFTIYELERESFSHCYIKTSDPTFTVKVEKKYLGTLFIILRG